MQCNCGNLLVPVFEGLENNNQFIDALTVRFIGGYDEFIDPVDDEPVEIIICGDCAADMMSLLPWAKKLLAPLVSAYRRDGTPTLPTLNRRDGW